MNDHDIDELFARTDQVDPAVLARVQSSITSSLKPVRPTPPVWALALTLLAISLVVSIGSAAWFGFSKQSTVLTISALAIFTWLAALVSASQMIPGGQRWKNPSLTEPIMTNPPMLLAVLIAAWLVITAIQFHDYELGNFIPQGSRCLIAGLIVAAPTGIATWLTLRRGFAVNPSAAALAAGTLAGLTGLTMLELHCAIFQAPHIMLWHTAVIPISAFVPFIVSKLSQSFVRS